MTDAIRRRRKALKPQVCSSAYAVKKKRIKHQQRNRDAAPDSGWIALEQRPFADVEILGVGPAQILHQFRERLGSRRRILVYGLGRRRSTLLGPAWLGLMPQWLSAGAATLFGAAAVLAGAAGLYFMTRIYRIKARPFWDHWQVSTSFFGTALSLGGLLIAAGWANALVAPSLRVLAGLIALGLAAELIGLVFHARAMRAASNEGAVAHHEQTTPFGYAYGLRNGLMAFALVALLTLAVVAPTGLPALVGWGAAAVAVLAAAVIGRALFYVLVIPTTMPGAFFWRNKGFEAHARETGFAEWQQVGVARETH